jgi:hypothetical protein
MCVNLEKVLGRIEDAGGSIDLCKSRFLANEIDFSGPKIGDIGVGRKRNDLSALRQY